MNLEFTTVKSFTYNGSPYRLERAEVTRHPQFWAAWRYSNDQEKAAHLLNCQVPSDILTSKIMLSKINDSWYCYRITPADPMLPLGKFSIAYTMRDPSILLPYQIRCVAHLCNSMVRNGAAADGSDTGIGKTYHALGVARELHLRPAIICRIAGIANWRRVCTLFGVEPLFIANWEQAKGSKFEYTQRSTHPVSGQATYRWKLPKDTLLIFDEAHMGGNVGSLNSALWMGAVGRASLSISATFADRPNRLKPLFSVLGIVPLPDGRGFEEFMSAKGVFRNQYDDLEALADRSDMQEFNRILYPFFGYRIAYTDPEVRPYFPEAVFRTEIVSLGQEREAAQNAAYAQLLAAVDRYRQLGKQAEALVADMRYRQETELLKVPALVDLTENYRDQGHSVVIFVNFLETLKQLANLLKTKSLIYGTQERDKIDRQKVIDDFQANRQRIIISTVNAGGQSISLHDLEGGHPRVSLICPTYDPIALVQVKGRTYRSGSKSVPIIKLVYAANTVEEKVAAAVALKMDNIAALNDGDLMEPDLFGILHGQDRRGQV